MFKYLSSTAPLRAPEDGSGAGSGGTAAPAPSAEQVVGGQDAEQLDFNSQEFRDVLAFDPFSPPKEEKTEAAPAKETSQGVEPAKGSSEPSPAPAAPEAPRESQEARELREARETINRLTQKVTELAKPAEQPRQQAAAEQQGAPEWTKPYAALQVPEQVMKALESESIDDRRSAMSALVQAVVLRAVGDTRRYVEEQMKSLRDEVPGIASGHVQAQSQADQMINDFYSGFRHLSSPRLRPIVMDALQAAAASWTQQGRQFQWADLRDYVGGELTRELGLTAPAPAASGGTGRTPARTQGVSGNGARPTGGPSSDFGADLL